MIVHSLDTLPPLQQTVYVASASYAAPPAQPVLTASLAPVAIGRPAQVLAPPPGVAPSVGEGQYASMIFMSLAALALLLCARGYTAGGQVRG